MDINFKCNIKYKYIYYNTDRGYVYKSNRFSYELIELHDIYICNKYKNVFAPGTLGVLPDTYLVPVSYILGVGVWHIDAI